MAFVGDVEGVLNKNIEESEDHSLISGIRLFQEEHGMGSERVSPAIAMLADMGVRREDVFKILVGLLREALVSEASTAQLDSINNLFGDVFDSLLEKPEFSAIPIAVLERQTVISEKQVKILAKSAPNGKPYTDLSFSLKQRIWASEPDVYRRELLPVLARLSQDQYLSGKVVQYTLMDATPELDKSRREENADLRTIHNRIGSNEKLLISTLRTIRHRFMETGSTAFCSVMLDVIFMSQESGNFEKLNADSSTRFAKALSDLKQASPIEASVKDLKSQAEKSVSEGSDTIAILLGSVTAVTELSTLLLIHLDSLARSEGEKLRKTVVLDDYTRDLCYLLYLGLGVRKMTIEKSFTFEDDSVLSAQLTMIACLMLDDIHREQASDDADLPDERLQKFAKTAQFLQRLLCSYAIKLFRFDDVAGVSRLRKPLEYVFIGSANETRERHVSEYMLGFISTDSYYMD
ncbi:hypothetical protein NDN08_007764 [Rhodosorus marinus]|uniref:Sister chromatid cohesion protein n=1 Tax=Rhodosorus marinus TaxID=101924 RepID=A0AAV8UYG9_9RHOD|nr:hypothetical protein NDN08_007764 [Rhodosorus marinus]